MKPFARRSLAVVSVVVATVGVAACSGSSSGSSAGSVTAITPAAVATARTAASGLVGPGCAAYAAAVPAGSGSVAGMALDPAATAAANNPLLTTLTAAVSGRLNKRVNLVGTLNGGQFTIFAPVDAAFKKLPAKTVTELELSKNSAMLTKILTYHVIAGQLNPGKIIGTQRTVEGGTVEVTGSGNTLKVNGADVICGGVKTANATVYLIDSVLTPPKN